MKFHKIKCGLEANQEFITLNLTNVKSNLYICFYLQSGMDQKTHDFYERLRVELDNSNTWPAEYLFKFIVPTTSQNILEVENAFNNIGAIIKTTASKTKKFTSISIDVTMNSGKDIIEKYQQLSNIKGIVSL